jgi:DNA-binding MarR family transcriptional regulator
MDGTMKADERTDERVMVLLLRIANRIERRLDEALAPVDLSLAKYGALTKLAHAEEPLSLGELAALLVSVRSNISQLVDRLEADGLVRRVEDPRDRRCVRAELTPLGRERQAAGAAVAQEVREEVAKLFAGVDCGILERALVELGGVPVS